MDDIYEHERARWMSSASKRKTFSERFPIALPMGLVIVQGAMFLVSAKHTSDTINLIAPGMGWAGVVGFELGLVIFSFLNYQAEGVGVKNKLWVLLECVLVIMIVLSNIAGSIDAVVSVTGIKELSFDAVSKAFGGLPLTTQVALVVGILFAFAVPLIFVASGHAFAHMIQSKVDGDDPLEAKWQSSGYPFVYRAYFSDLTRQGMRPSEAKLIAKQMAAGYFGAVQQPVEIPAVSSGNTDNTPIDKGRTRADKARQMMMDDPALADLSVRVLAERTGINKDVWGPIKKELKPSNGKVHNE